MSSVRQAKSGTVRKKGSEKAFMSEPKWVLTGAGSIPSIPTAVSYSTIAAQTSKCSRENIEPKTNIELSANEFLRRDAGGQECQHRARQCLADLVLSDSYLAMNERMNLSKMVMLISSVGERGLRNFVDVLIMLTTFSRLTVCIYITIFVHP